MKPGEKVTSSAVDTTKMQRSDARTLDGISGLRKIGVKDLSYKLVFIASSVSNSDSRFGFANSMSSADDEGEEVDVESKFTIHERHQVIEMK